MCYSAMVEQDIKSYMRQLDARIDYPEYERLFQARLSDKTVKIPKAMEASFLGASVPEASRIQGLIAEFKSQRAKELEAELFRQKKRLGDAERALKVKVTKAAAESHRIGSTKIQWHLDKLAELKREEPDLEDSRIFPFWYAPVVVAEAGRPVVRPMRYHCRPAGKPESYDRKYDGLYNARRDNLEGFWDKQFGHDHAIVVMTGFFENVARHDMERREMAPGEKPENVVLNFKPQPPFAMRVACLWSRWQAPGAQDLLSFAAITDEPPPEVAATGHDRCVILLKDENLAAWLNPEQSDRQRLFEVLDDRERPYFEHRMAA